MSASCSRPRWAPAGGARQGMRVTDSTAGGRPGALLPPGGASGRRWRGLVADALLVAALVLTFPISVLTYIGAGQSAAVAVTAVALVLSLVGWVVGRGEE